MTPDQIQTHNARVRKENMIPDEPKPQEQSDALRKKIAAIKPNHQPDADRTESALTADLQRENAILVKRAEYLKGEAEQALAETREHVSILQRENAELKAELSAETIYQTEDLKKRDQHITQLEALLKEVPHDGHEPGSFANCLACKRDRLREGKE